MDRPICVSNGQEIYALDIVVLCHRHDVSDHVWEIFTRSYINHIDLLDSEELV